MSTATVPTVAAYRIDPAHSSAQFSVRHLMISNVRGEFTQLSGEFLFNPEDLAGSRIDAEIDVASINTRDAQRDAHLKSADFFDVENHPAMSFHSRRITGGAGEYKVAGDLTIRGVTREVTLHVEGPTPETKDPWGNYRLGATATFKVNRKDFGLTWNVGLEAGGVLVGEEVKITLEIEAIRKA